MDESFRLEPSKHRAVFEKEIEPQFLLVTTAVDRPTAVVIAAQTGAGKSNLLPKTQEQLQHNAVPVNTDELRRFHPNYEEIGRLGDDRSAERTHHDASAWKDELLNSSIQNRRNIILESVFKDGGALVDTIGQLKAAGYEVIVRFVSVHRRLSILGVHAVTRI